MSNRLVDSPANHGWSDAGGGKWTWNVSGSGGAGAGMVISETEPTDKVEGMQWLNPTTGLVLFWDDEKWLQMPTTGAAGKDGVDGLWADNGDTSISYNAGNVGIGTDNPESALHVREDFATAIDTIADSTTNMSGVKIFNNAGGTTSSGVWFANGSHWSGIAGRRSNPSDWATHLSFFTHEAMTLNVNQATERMRISGDGRVDITGSLYVNGTPKIGTKELIETLSTLRAATQDENTVEGLRDSISNAIGGLIEKFEAMQSPATQEISDE